MRNVLALFTVMLVMSPFSYASAKKYFKYQAPKTGFQITTDAKKFIFDGPDWNYQFKLRTCNKKLVKNFWKDVDRRVSQKTLSLPAKVKQAARYTYGREKKAFPPYTKYAKRLENLPKSVAVLIVRSKKQCAKKSKRKPAGNLDEDVEYVLKEVSSIGLAFNPVCKDCTQKQKTAHDYFNACIAEVCPQKERELDYLSAYWQVISDAQIDSSEYTNSMKPKLLEVLDTVHKTEMKDYIELSSILNSDYQVDDPDTLMAHNLFFMLEYFYKVDFDLSLDEEKGRYTKAEAKPIKSLKELSNLSKKEQAIVYQASAAVIESPEFLESMNTSLFPAETYFKVKYPSASLPEAIVLAAKEAREDLDAIKQDEDYRVITQLKVFYNTFFDEEVMSRVSSGSDLTPQALNDLHTSFAAAKFLKSLMLNSKVKEMLRKRTYEDVNATLRSRASVKGTADFLEVLRNEEIMTDLKLEAMLNCGELFDLGLLVSPDKNELEAFSKSVTDGKTRFTDKVLGKFSDKTKARVGKKIADVNFLMPSSRGEFAKSFSNQITDFGRNALSGHVTREGIKHGNYEGIMAAMVYGGGSKSPYSLYSSILELCESFSLTDGLSDAAYTSAGSVMSSWVSMRYPKLGSDVILHELGHIASTALQYDFQVSKQSRKKYKETKQCLQKMHGKNEDRFQEEDWADLTMGLASGTDNNPWCAFQFDSKEGFELKDEDDTHSADLFRLFHIETVKSGDLPESCKSYLKAAGHKESFKMCLPN